MADAADSTPASGGQFALTVADLNTAFDDEPRIEDIRLAEALGMERPRNIRKLIERHREALERLGPIRSTVEQNTGTRGRGRPGRTFWLNKRQALYLFTKSETPRATEATLAMVAAFDAHLAGRLAAPAPDPSLRPGPDGLVSSRDVAATLGRRHKHVLRTIDLLAARRPELRGRHLRESTYVHPRNRRPWRCVHLDRIGLAALLDALHMQAMALAAPALPPRPAAPAPVAPPAAAPAGPTVERDGFAVMRIAGEVVVVDMARHAVGPAERAVRLHWDGSITTGTVDRDGLGPSSRPRVALATPRTAQSLSGDLVRVLGAVVAAQPAAAPGVSRSECAPPRSPRRGPARRVLHRAAPSPPDLAQAEVCGTA